MRWLAVVAAVCVVGVAAVIFLWSPRAPKAELRPPAPAPEEPPAPDVDPHKVIYPIRPPRPFSTPGNAGPGAGSTPPTGAQPPPAGTPPSGASAENEGRGFAGFPGVIGTTPLADGGTRKRFSPDHDGIKAAMRDAIPEVKECYEAWLQTNPDLQGKLVLAFSIAPTDAGQGEVRDLSVSSKDINHLPFEGCVQNVMAGLQFGQPINDGTGEPAAMGVKYPLVFSTGDGG